MGQHGVVDQPGISHQIGVSEAGAGEGERRRRQQVGVGCGLVIDDVTVHPAPGEQAVVALQVLVGP